MLSSQRITSTRASEMSRHPTKLALLLAFSAPLITGGAPKAAMLIDRETDRDQIVRVLADWEGAWNAHDMRRLAALFREDAVWVLWTGEVWVGRARFESGMTEVHKTVYRNSVQREQLEELTFVGPDAAVLRFQSTLIGDTRYPDQTIHSRKILVLTRKDGQWRIGWGQNTRFLSDTQLPVAKK